MSQFHRFIFSCLLVLALNNVSAQEFVGGNAVPLDTVSVTGVGEIKAEPDQATISLSISALDMDAEQAKKQADEHYKSVLAAINEHSIDKKHIRTTRFNMQPEYEWRREERILKGTKVERGMNVTVTDLDKLAPLLQALIANGASQIDQLSTGFQNEGELKRKALAAAVEDAKGKAEFLTKQLNRKLGYAHQIYEANASVPMYQNAEPVMMRASAMEASYSAPQEMLGELTVSATVRVVFHTE